MRNVLITGGAGFIGSNLIRFMLGRYSDLQIINLDVLTYAGRVENLNNLPDPSRHSLLQIDIRDQANVKNVMTSYDIDTIIHLAAESHVDRSIAAPSLFIETNVLGTFNLLEAAKQSWGGAEKSGFGNVRFHHVSTDEVYGSLEPTDPPFSETNRYMPNSPYAASKAAADHLVRAYSETYKLPVTISNCSNNYGPYQYPEKLIPLIIRKAMKGENLPIYGDGLQIRDWLFVEDHCEAICMVLEEGEVGEVYNIGGENQPTNLELVKAICAEMDSRLPDSPNVPHESLISFVPDRLGHDRRYAMDTGKIRKSVGWKPKHDLQQGIQKTVDWYLENLDWVLAIENGNSYQEWMQKNYEQRETV